MPSKNFDKLKIEKLPNSEAQVTGEMALPFLVECRAEALKALGERVNIPGFRQGHIPEEVLTKNIGEMKILEEVAEVALGREYENIIKESKLLPLGRPQVAITKLAPGIPLEFKITLALEPEFALPDYKKIASEIKNEDKNKRRMEIVEALSKATSIELPKIFVGRENQAKAEFIIAKIAEVEKIEPTKEELEKEVNHIFSHHKDADPLRVRLFVYQMLRNQKTLEFLETREQLL